MTDQPLLLLSLDPKCLKIKRLSYPPRSASNQLSKWKINKSRSERKQVEMSFRTILRLLVEGHLMLNRGKQRLWTLNSRPF